MKILTKVLSPILGMVKNVMCISSRIIISWWSKIRRIDFVSVMYFILCAFFALASIAWLSAYLICSKINPLPAAIFATILGILISMKAKHSDNKYKRSEFYLKSAIEGVKKALSLIEDGNNDRVVWISAARVLERSIQISEKITEKEHVTIFEMEHEGYRRDFTEILGYEKDRTGTFFYGVEDLATPIDQAATDASVPTKVKLSSVRELSESSIHTIWKFARFPDNYEDPISGKFSQDEINKIRFLIPSLYQYLKHKRKT